MSKVDVSNWGDFKIGDLFDISPTKAYKLTNKDLFEENGQNPVVVNSGFNNGIGGFTNLDCTEEAGVITFTDTAAKSTDSFFFQEKAFVGYSHVQRMRLKDRTLNKYEAMFINTVISTKLSGRYDFISKMTRSDISDIIIKLPILKNGTPDWNYMEAYIKRIEKIVENSISQFGRVKNLKRQKINSDNWVEFHLYDDFLFDIDSGTKLDRIKMDTSVSEVAFVGRSNVNNGITAKVKKIEGLEPYSKGYLTLALGGEYLGSCFVQLEDFYTSQNVVVLIPKWDMNFYVKQFIATVIFIESQNNYQAFIKELNAHIKHDFAIKLPVTENGVPDWTYMENYMKGIELKIQERIDLLKTI